MEIVTSEDLRMFKQELFAELRKLISEAVGTMPEPVEGYKTKHVREILGCSTNKLVSLRITRKIRVKKVGGTLYYNKEDVRKLMEQGY